MPKRNGKPQSIHGGMLIPSTADDIALARAVKEKFRELCGTFQRIRGVPLKVPASLYKDIMRWKALLNRHKKRDFRHSEAEKESMKTVAEWTVALNAALRNNPKPSIEWKD